MSLIEQHCLTITTPTLLSEAELKTTIKETPFWQSSAEKKSISRDFKFKSYQQTLLFINAISEIIQKENHHPDIKFGYNYACVEFSTHSVGGITLYDLICAAHIDQLYLNKFNT